MLLWHITRDSALAVICDGTFVHIEQFMVKKNGREVEMFSEAICIDSNSR